MKDSTYLAQQLRDVHDDIDGAREDHSWQALAALRRQAMQVREAYNAALAEEKAAGQEEEISPEDALEAVCSFIREAPEAVLEQLHEAFGERVRPGLQVIDGGAEADG